MIQLMTIRNPTHLVNLVCIGTVNLDRMRRFLGIQVQSAIKMITDKLGINLPLGEYPVRCESEVLARLESQLGLTCLRAS